MNFQDYSYLISLPSPWETSGVHSSFFSFSQKELFLQRPITDPIYILSGPDNFYLNDLNFFIYELIIDGNLWL